MSTFPDLRDLQLYSPESENKDNTYFKRLLPVLSEIMYVKEFYKLERTGKTFIILMRSQLEPKLVSALGGVFEELVCSVSGSHST